MLNWEKDHATGAKINSGFSKIAVSYGLKGFELNNSGEVKELIKDVFNDKAPTLVHCKIDSTEDVLPMLLGGQKMNEMYPFKETVNYEE